MNINKHLNIIAGHILAATIQKNYPVKISNIGLDDDGFYLEFCLLGESLSTNDFNKLEKLFTKITSGAENISYSEIKKTDLLSKCGDNKYMQSTINASSDAQLPIVSFGNYFNLCEKMEFAKTNCVKHLKLVAIGGAYWLGDAKNEQLTRIKGIASDNKESFEQLVNEYNERVERDHRTVGKNLDIFTFNPLAGQGMAIWLPNGAIIKKEIRNFLGELEFKYGFQSVYSPILGNVELYKTSGHWEHYQENMFPVMKVDNEELVLRPMTCPHHILFYKRKPLSYKNLPMRLCEESMLHRYESSGGLTGLERVREMVLEDTHIFCTPEQLENEVLNCYHIVSDAHKGLNSKIHQIELSLHDPKDKAKYHHDEKMWKHAESTLKEMMIKHNIAFVEKIGEAAFYGPKIDFQVKTALNRVITVSTIQLDFLLPERFELTYKDKDGLQKPTVMLHLGIVGTYERLVSILLEQTKGVLPLWLSPVQIVIIPINNEVHNDYCQALLKSFHNKMIRAELDDRDERIAKKIRDAQTQKVPYQIIIGDDEVKTQKIAIRKYGEENSSTMTMDEFLKLITTKIQKREA